MKQRIYFDMDGTLAVWNKDKTLEEVGEVGYFLNLLPHESVVDAAKRLIKSDTYDVYILSHVISKTAEIDKNSRLDRYLCEVYADHRIFVPYGENKSCYIKNKTNTDVLIDDFSDNLRN